MERIDQLEQQIRRLSLAIRIGIALVIAAAALHGVITLTCAPGYRNILAESSGSVELPVISALFMGYWQLLAIGVSVLATMTIVSLLISSRRTWIIPAGIGVALLIIAITQLAAFSYQLPLLHLIRSMGE